MSNRKTLTQKLSAVALLAIGSLSNTLLAQTPSLEELQRQISDPMEVEQIMLSPSQTREVAERLGVAVDSRHFQRFLQEAALPDDPGELSLDSETSESYQIVRHYRGEEGLLLPTIDTLQLPNDIENSLQQFINADVAAINQFVEQKYTSPTNLKDCRENRTYRLPLGDFNDPEFKDGVVYDMLFVWKGETLKDTKEVFGESVAVQAIPRGEASAEAFAAEALRVACLPYRIRLTPLAIFYDEGENALRNFTADQEGEGILDPRAKVFLNREGSMP
jgi:hypothetical protein